MSRAPFEVQCPLLKLFTADTVMTTYFNDYFWRNGKPIGRGVVSTTPQQHTYKIVSDPYFKRISLERYNNGVWDSVIYDSQLLDFRKLNERDQLAWQKEIIEELPDQQTCLIRDHDDRVVFLEKHQFQKNMPAQCEIFSPQGLLLAIQKISYKFRGDIYDGVTLLDGNGRTILKKIYVFDEISRQFTDLLEENWDTEK